MKTTVFDDAGAKSKYKAMLEHLESLNLPINEGDKVLEVGSGVGWHTYFFEGRGCKVLSTDGRPDNVQEHLSRFPHRWVGLCDLDQLHSHDEYGRFDIVHCYGVLYHLQHPEMAIADLAGLCDRFTIIETDALGEDEDRIEFRGTEPSIASQSIHGARNVMGRPWLFRELSKHFPFVYCPKTQPNHPDYPVRFPAPVNGRAKKFIMIGSKIDLQPASEITGILFSPLVHSLPMHYKTAADPLILKDEVYPISIDRIDLVGRWGNVCDIIPEKLAEITDDIKDSQQNEPVRLKYQSGKGRLRPADGVHRILALKSLGAEYVQGVITAFDNEIDPEFIAERPVDNDGSQVARVAVIGLGKLGTMIGSIISRCGKFAVTGIDPDQARVDQVNAFENGFPAITDLHEADGVACAFLVDTDVKMMLQALKELKNPPATVAIVAKMSDVDLQDALNTYPSVCYCPVTYDDPMLPKLIMVGGYGEALEVVTAIMTETYEFLSSDPIRTLTICGIDMATAFTFDQLLTGWRASEKKLIEGISGLPVTDDGRGIINAALAALGIGEHNAIV